MTVADYAKLYGNSERTIKRYKSQGLPLHDEQAMRQVIGLKQSRLGVSKLFAKAPVSSQQSQPPQEAQEFVNIPQLFAEHDKATRDLVSVYFAVVKLGWNDAALRAKLKPRHRSALHRVVRDLIRAESEQLDNF